MLLLFLGGGQSGEYIKYWLLRFDDYWLFCLFNKKEKKKKRKSQWSSNQFSFKKKNNRKIKEKRNKKTPRSIVAVPLKDFQRT
jgi:hypothetical protein